MSNAVQFDKYNPFRVPDWRLQRVLSLVDRPFNPGRCTRRDDQVIRDYKRFLLRYRRYTDQERQQLFYENPGLYYGHLIYENQPHNPEVAMLIEARLLAGFDDSEICRQCETIPEAIAYYEQLFFNVRDRLRAGDWILNYVLTPAIMQPTPQQVQDAFRQRQISQPFYDATLKYFAYFGGKVACEFMIHGGRRSAQPRSEEDLLDYLEDEFKHKMYRRTVTAMQTFEINRFNVTELFANFTSVMNIRMNADNPEQQKSLVNQNMSRMMDEMPWSVGRSGEANLAGTAVTQFDNSAVELRSSDLLKLAAGDTDESVKHLLTVTMPPPREGS